MPKEDDGPPTLVLPVPPEPTTIIGLTRLLEAPCNRRAKRSVRGWEDSADGTAALAVLLLQDLAVAPLLVILPLVAGSGPQSSGELGVLVAK